MVSFDSFEPKMLDQNLFFEKLVKIFKTYLDEPKKSTVFKHILLLIEKQWPVNNCLWDIAFYLTINEISKSKSNFKDQLINELSKLWSQLPRPKKIVFHREYKVPSYWEPYFENEKVKENFEKYFQNHVEINNHISWNTFFEDVQIFFEHSFTEMNESQFRTLMTILELQTDSNAELQKKINRTSQSISRDKKFLYERGILHRSLWIDFSRIGLEQIDLLIIQKSLSKYPALINPDSPWMFSSFEAHVGTNYNLYTFLLPKNNPEVEKEFQNLVEQILNTTDSIELFLIKPDYSSATLYHTINYSFYDPKTAQWRFPMGYPRVFSNMSSSHPQAIIVNVASKIKKTKIKPHVSKNLVKAMNIFYKKGMLSIRELMKELNLSFHKTRLIYEQLIQGQIVKPRFSSTIGSSLHNIMTLITDTPEKIEKVKKFGTALPEQYFNRINAEKYVSFVSDKQLIQGGGRAYFRVPPSYSEEILKVIKSMVTPEKLISIPLLGAKTTYWEIPVERWDEEKQQWRVERDDFQLMF